LALIALIWWWFVGFVFDVLDLALMLLRWGLAFCGLWVLFFIEVLYFAIQRFLRLLFFGLFTTAIYKIYYNHKTSEMLCVDDSAINTNNEFKILLTAKKDLK
jgi:hypothetical protein